VVEVENLERN